MVQQQTTFQKVHTCAVVPNDSRFFFNQLILQQMSDQAEPKVTSIKTYVRGTYLYSDGCQYEEKHKDAAADKVEKVVQDKIGIADLKRELAQKKQEIKRKKQSKNQKLVLIPIRDTPVEPVPQVVNDNQKCERSIQDQFEYFQSYISQKEKQKKFQEEEQFRLDLFMLEQEAYKQKQSQIIAPPRMNIVMQKEESKPKKKMAVKIKIKKVGKNEEQDFEEKSKIRIIQ